MSAQPSIPLFMPNPNHPDFKRKRRFPRPQLPQIKLDGQDKQALRKVGVYTVATVMACVAITILLVVLALWIHLFMVLV